MNKKGIVSLEMLMAFLVILSIFLLLLTQTSVLTMLNTKTRIEKIKAYRLANIGIELAKYDLDNNIRAKQITTKFETGEVVVKVNSSTNSYNIVSTGYIPNKSNMTNKVIITAHLKKIKGKFKIIRFDYE